MQEITIDNKVTGVILEAYDHDKYAEVFISRTTDEEAATSLMLDKSTGTIIIGNKTITPLMWKMIKDLMDQRPDSI